MTFHAKVSGVNVSVSNQAIALEGQTQLLTNVVSTSVKELPVPSVTPNTGDPTNIPLLARMMGISLMGIVVTLAVLLFPRKKESMKYNPQQNSGCAKHSRCFAVCRWTSCKESVNSPPQQLKFSFFAI